MHSNHQNLQHRYPKQQLCFMKCLFQSSTYRIQTSSLWAAGGCHSWPGCFAARYARHASPVLNLRALPTCRWNGTLASLYYQGTTPKNVSINRFIQTFLKRKLLDYFVGGWRILVIHGGILVVDALKSFLGGGTEDLQLLHHHESWLRRACWTARQLKGFVPHSGHDGARLCALISISLGSDDDSKSEGFFQCRSDWVNMCCMELWT